MNPGIGYPPAMPAVKPLLVAIALAVAAGAAWWYFAAHMQGPRGRNDAWIRQATDLQKKMDQAHSDLDRQMKALGDLIYALPDVTRTLEPLVDKSSLLPDAVAEAAFKRVQAEAKRNAEELEQTRRLVLPR